MCQGRKQPLNMCKNKPNRAETYWFIYHGLKKVTKRCLLSRKGSFLTNELRTIGDEDHNSNQLRYPILYSCLTDEDYIANIKHGIGCDYTRYLLKSNEIDAEEEKENIMCTNKVIRTTSIEIHLGDSKLTTRASKIRRY